MARNRMIKPEFWSSETLMRVSRDARLTFIGLWNFCDDYGFCINSNRRIMGDVYPYDETVNEAKIKQWISELLEQKLLIPVDYNGKHLFFVKGWGEHQTVQHKSKRSNVHVNDLEQVIKDSLKSHESLIEVYLESHAPKRKKKEKEESNKEKGTLADRKNVFADEINSTWNRLGAESYLPKSELQTFFNWYSETNKAGIMKMETFEFFEIGKRLATWKKKYDANNTQTQGSFRP
jgi:hypothetical protein